MKKRIRGMTSASRGEKERKRGWDVDAVEREWQNGASEKRASHRRCGARRHGEKRRRTKKAVGRFARVATLSCERREETGYMTMKREKRSTGRPVGRMNERRREAQVRRRASGRIEKEVNGGLADGEEREREREINVSGEERERGRESRLGMSRGTVTETKRGESR